MALAKEPVVYVLVATAIYDQGVVGVFASPEEARAAADSLWKDSDGHHRFRVDKRALGEVHDVFPRWWTDTEYYRERDRTTGELEIEYAG